MAGNGSTRTGRKTPQRDHLGVRSEQNSAARTVAQTVRAAHYLAGVVLITSVSTEYRKRDGVAISDLMRARIDVWRAGLSAEDSNLTDEQVLELIQADDAARKADFLAREREIRLRERRERNAKELDRRPRMYRDAIADHPGVVAWVDGLCELIPDVGDRPCRLRGNACFLYGGVGTGKTFQALGIPALLAARDQPAAFSFLRAVDYLDGQMNADFADKEALYRQTFGAELLILDDLFAGGDHRRSGSDLYRLLDARFADERPTILTTNLAGKALTDAMGERLMDRLRESAVSVKLDGASRREFRPIFAE
jgi:DNA replication protein DnaC